MGRGKPRYHPAWLPVGQAAHSLQQPTDAGRLAAPVSLRLRFGLLA
jgi:hypothetical protein